MSIRSSPSRGEDEELNLSLEFQGLQISVRGNAEKAAAFVQRLASDAGPVATGASGSAGYPHPVVLPVPSSAPSVASWQEVDPSTPPTRYESRDSIEASFAACPPTLRALASSLSTTSAGWTAEQRIQRAWKAGSWAGAVRAGRVNRTPTIDIGNRYYAVVRGANISSPKVYRTSRELFGAVGQLEGSDTICHGFPSKAETQVYLAGAGYFDVPFPQ